MVAVGASRGRHARASTSTPRAFLGRGRSDGEFKFMVERGVAREADRLRADGAASSSTSATAAAIPSGSPGPALVHSRARTDMVWFIQQRLRRRAARRQRRRRARHRGVDLRHDARHDAATGKATQGGHGLHMRAINKVRAAGSIAAAVGTGIDQGRHHARVRDDEHSVRAHRLDSRRRSAARRDHRRARRAGRDARARRSRRRWRS